MSAPEPYQQLQYAFDALPGIGPRAAARLAQFVLDNPQGEALARAIQEARASLHLCPRCCRYTSDELCGSCRQAAPAESLTIVATLSDAAELETCGIRTLFVMHGLLSPVAGIGPSKLHFDELRQRIAGETVRELRLALPEGVEADATEYYIRDLFAGDDIIITRCRMADLTTADGSADRSDNNNGTADEPA